MVVYLVLVLQYGWNLKIVEVVGHLLAFRKILLATFLYIRKSGLEIEWGAVGQWNAGYYAHIQAGLPVATIQTGIVGIDKGEGRTDAESVIRAAVVVVVTVVETVCPAVVISAVTIILCCCRHQSQEQCHHDEC
ncbi:Uncharacterised protein [Segatella copri]|nr:Uncharacterised protein [Segatella copri]